MDNDVVVRGLKTVCGQTFNRFKVSSFGPNLYVMVDIISSWSWVDLIKPDFYQVFTLCYLKIKELLTLIVSDISVTKFLSWVMYHLRVRCKWLYFSYGIIGWQNRLKWMRVRSWTLLMDESSWWKHVSTSTGLVLRIKCLYGYHVLFPKLTKRRNRILIMWDQMSLLLPSVIRFASSPWMK